MQLRYAMNYVVITFIVLLFLNIYCAEISQTVFHQNKQTAMLEKARLTATEIENLELVHKESVEAAVRKIGDTNLTRLLVTDANGLIIYDSTNGTGTFALLPQVVCALGGTDIFTWHYRDGIIQAEAAIPVVSSGGIEGCVYMMEYDTQQGNLIASLQNNILIITLVLELCVLVFSLVYASRFSGRLRKVMHSVRIIQRGDYTHKVDLGGHDELSFLGQEINDLTARLQTSESKRHRFVSDASHELKTPLASIKLLSDSILQNDMDPDTVREFVSDIGNEAERLNRMTQKLLTLTKGENMEELPEREIIYVLPTVQRVVKMLSGIAGDNGITLHQKIRQDLPVLVQEDDLYQILFNLVENGIKYNFPGGDLFISMHKEQDMAVLQVRDTGMGIPADAIEHVFERFYRVDKARSRQTGGSGLGLAIVRTMVNRNNGEIHVQSTVGEGTVFTVAFPCFDTVEDAL